MRYKFIILSTGRSGSKFIANALQNYTVGHEVLKEDGGVGWKLLLPECTNRWNKDNAEHIIHLAREPLACIASMTTHTNIVFHALMQQLGMNIYFARGKCTDEQKIIRSAQAWLQINKRCMELADKTILLSNLQEDLRKYGAELDMSVSKNPRKHMKLTMDDLESVGLAEPVFNLWNQILEKYDEQHS